MRYPNRIWEPTRKVWRDGKWIQLWASRKPTPEEFRRRGNSVDDEFDDFSGRVDRYIPLVDKTSDKR